MIVALLVKVAVIWNFLASTMIDRSIFSPSHVGLLLISIVRLELSIDVITVAAGIHRPLTGRPLNCSCFQFRYRWGKGDLFGTFK